MFFSRVLSMLSLFLAALSLGVTALLCIAVALLRGAEIFGLVRSTHVGN